MTSAAISRVETTNWTPGFTAMRGKPAGQQRVTYVPEEWAYRRLLRGSNDSARVSPDDFAAHRPRSTRRLPWPGSRLTAEQGQGVGATRFPADALSPDFRGIDQFGIAALLIHCKDEHARDFLHASR